MGRDAELAVFNSASEKLGEISFKDEAKRREKTGCRFSLGCFWLLRAYEFLLAS
jgi:hypothetical protein